MSHADRMGDARNAYYAELARLHMACKFAFSLPCATLESLRETFDRVQAAEAAWQQACARSVEDDGELEIPSFLRRLAER